MMNGMADRPLLDSVWYSTDRPVLLGIAEALVASPRGFIPAEQIATSVAIPLNEVVAAGQRLNGEYVRIEDLTTFDGPDWAAMALTPMGLREVGLWPNSEAALDRFVAALESAAAKAAPEEKERLKAVIAAIGGMGRDLATSVIGAILTAQL
jgi:hypothetical protein